MKDPEDEAFEEVERQSGWRKRQIVDLTEREQIIEEIARELETKFTGPFGRDTVQSFSAYIRAMKKAPTREL